MLNSNATSDFCSSHSVSAIFVIIVKFFDIFSHPPSVLPLHSTYFQSSKIFYFYWLRFYFHFPSFFFVLHVVHHDTDWNSTANHISNMAGVQIPEDYTVRYRSAKMQFDASIQFVIWNYKNSTYSRIVFSVTVAVFYFRMKK